MLVTCSVNISNPQYHSRITLEQNNRCRTPTSSKNGYNRLSKNNLEVQFKLFGADGLGCKMYRQTINVLSIAVFKLIPRHSECITHISVILLVKGCPIRIGGY